jgi:hypothetical protein
MFRSRIVLIVSILLLATGVALLIWGVLPSIRVSSSFSVPAQPMPLDLSGGNQNGAVLDEGIILVNLVIPDRVRLGQTQELSLRMTLQGPGSIQPGDARENPQAMVISETGGSLTGYNLVAEARMDSALQGTTPSGSVKQPINPGRPIEFQWSFTPRQPGDSENRLWIYLDFVDGASGTNDQVALLAHPFIIHCQSLFGFETAYVLGMGGFLIFISLLLNYETIEKIVIKLVKKLNYSNKTRG